jgi:hypothetical protein
VIGNKEDQMAQDTHDYIKSFQVTPETVAVGEDVKLFAEFKCPITDTYANAQFRFVTPDGAIEDFHCDPATQASATWTATCSAPVECVTLCAEVFRKAQKGEEILDHDEQTITVVQSAPLKILPAAQAAVGEPVVEGDPVTFEALDSNAQPLRLPPGFEIHWFVDDVRSAGPGNRVELDTAGLPPRVYSVAAKVIGPDGRVVHPEGGNDVGGATQLRIKARPISRFDTLKVSLQRSQATATRDQILWAMIRERTLALSFSDRSFTTFVDAVLVGDETSAGKYGDGAVDLNRKAVKLGATSFGMAAYDLLKTASELFLLINCGVLPENAFPDGIDSEAEAARGFDVGDLTARLQAYFPQFPPGRLPYLDRIVRTVFQDRNPNSTRFFASNALTSRANAPCLLELVWSYWHEEGMLVQTMNAITRRFQNMRAPGERDPLAHLEIDPLRPLNNLIWGYIQDETNLLTVKRRAYEYDHHYGLTLYGKAVPTLRPADSRSKFLEAFHNLLHMTAVFYKEDNDTTVIADGYPLLNALREVHLVLAQGAHNQFGDLPWTARSEMLMQQWILARPEMREFLQSRPMVPYKEGWMPQVDTMKTLQGWSDVTVTHFRDLGVYGEQILLTIRYGDWIDVNDENAAKNWARYWRPEVQAYLHAYRAVTGVDLTNPEGVDYTMPAVHLQKRLAMQRTR